MATDLTTYAAQCGQAAAALEREAGRIALGLAQTGLSLALLAIHRDGLPGRPRYSLKLVPTFYFAGRALNQGGRTYVKQHRRGTWGAFRAAQGLRSDVVDFTYSGRTLRSVQAQLLSQQNGRAQAGLLASTSENARILAFGIQRYGDFLEPTADIAGQLRVQATRETEAVLRRYIQD